MKRMLDDERINQRLVHARLVGLSVKYHMSQNPRTLLNLPVRPALVPSTSIRPRVFSSWLGQQILFRKRFMDFQTDEEIIRLVDDSVRSWTTGQYDDFQQKTNGYLK